MISAADGYNSLTMPIKRRAVLSALPAVAGFSTLAAAQSSAGRGAPDPLGVRGDFPVANTSLFLLEPLVNRRTKLVSVAWVSHQNGYRHDLRTVADLARAHGAFCYTDGIQAVGMFPVDVKAAGVDAMAIGTYKWGLGSYGVAPFYVSRKARVRVRTDRYGWRNAEKQLGPTDFQIHQTAKTFDYATPAFGPIYQLGAGLDYLAKVGVDRIDTHTVALAHRLQRGLRTLGFDVLTPDGNRISIVAFKVTKAADAITTHLAAANTLVSLRENGTQVRVSPALFNTDADIDRFLTVAEGLQ